MEELYDNKVPFKVVQLFIENTNKIFENSNKTVDQCSVELKDMTKSLTETLNIINRNPSNQDIEDKLDIINNKVLSMITVIKTVSLILGLCMAAAIFGSQLLFGHNYEKIVEKIEADHRIDQSSCAQSEIKMLNEKVNRLMNELREKNETE
jgi:hypothetical protein